MLADCTFVSDDSAEENSKGEEVAGRAPEGVLHSYRRHTSRYHGFMSPRRHRHKSINSLLNY